MPPPEQRASLDEVLKYTPETYFSEEDVALIRSAFNGPTGAKLIKVIRKALLPSMSDPDLPIEEYAKDMFMSLVDFRQMQDSEAKPVAMGLQLAGKIVVGGLINLKQIANIQEESSINRAARRAKDSTK